MWVVLPANFRHTVLSEADRSMESVRISSVSFRKPCQNLKVDHSDYLALLRKIASDLPGVKKVFVRSGIRFDYVMADTDDTFLRELCKYHISGQLRVAPEHISDAVLDKMGKPHNAVYEQFIKRYQKVNADGWKRTIRCAISDVVTSWHRR